MRNRFESVLSILRRVPFLHSTSAFVSASTVVCCLFALGACRDDPPPPAPPLIRAEVTPDFARLAETNPEKGVVPEWNYSLAIVQSDLRDAHAWQAPQELILPLPKGAMRVHGAFAALRNSGGVASRKGRAHVVLEVAVDDAWRELWKFDGALADLMERWSEIDVALPANHDARARARATLSDVDEPETLQLLCTPLRAPMRERSKLPNVLVISVDTLRADHLSCYGYRRVTSPRIDALAKDGVLFERALSPAPWTLPSYGSLFTSHSPAVHRAGINTAREDHFLDGTDTTETKLEALRTDLATWAERFAQAGYDTAGFHSNPYLRPYSGVNRGFARWVYYRFRAATGVDLALEWITSRARAPWLCFVHFFDVHQPFAPPAPFDRKFSEISTLDYPGYPPKIEDVREKGVDDALKTMMIAQYDGEIAYTDDQIGRLLETLRARGALENTLIVLHSDHGEELWDHGGFEHGHTLHEELLHVPLVMSFEGRLPKDARIASTVRMIDVLPTVLELAGLPALDGAEGRSLLPLVRGESSESRRSFAEAILYGAREIKIVEEGERKLVWRAGEEPKLHDVRAPDPEARDLATSEKERADELQSKLRKRYENLRALNQRGSAMTLDEATRRQLAETGYAGAY